jgi:D-alanyl-D-alanine carboxypeptidase
MPRTLTATFPVLCLILLLFGLGPRITGAQAPAEALHDQESGQDWSTVLHQWIGSEQGLCDATGGVLLVQAPSGQYLGAAGTAGISDQTPVLTGDRFEIGSNTKSFTVVLALQLQEAGKLSMDDSLASWLPELSMAIPDAERITLRQLAGNISGIPDYADPLMQPLVDSNDQAGLARGWTPEQLVQLALNQGGPQFKPGTDWAYSSTNFILLGMVIEAASGEKLVDLYRQKIFQPLGMTSSYYAEQAPDPGNIVHGHYQVPGGDFADMTGWNASQGGAAGAIVSTAEDMARYARGLMAGELFQEPNSLHQMLTLREVGLEQGGMLMSGYALGLLEFRNAGVQLIGHAGQTPGFQTVWAAVPEQDTYIVFLTNSGTCPAGLLPATLTAQQLGLEPAG